MELLILLGLTVSVSGICFIGAANMKRRGMKFSITNFMITTNGNGFILFCMIPFALPFVLVQMARETSEPSSE